eukprot:Mrub_12949.p1 GENE.Mrub_12949~~Mrub_12949.p1  ORF type:complete len:148 (-),score=6.98 Mrub_12949:92-475(-)
MIIESRLHNAQFNRPALIKDSYIVLVKATIKYFDYKSNQGLLKLTDKYYKKFKEVLFDKDVIYFNNSFFGRHFKQIITYMGTNEIQMTCIIEVNTELQKSVLMMIDLGFLRDIKKLYLKYNKIHNLY